MRKRIWGLVLVLTMLLSLVPAAVNAADNGTCGDNVIWSFDSGILTISGAGNMDNYPLVRYRPWYDYVSSINKVIINSGVKNIGENAFYNCTNLSSVVLPNTIREIQDGAFYGCKNLSDITIPDSCDYLGYNVMYGTGWYDNQPNGAMYCGNFLYGYKGEIAANTTVSIKNGIIGICKNAFNVDGNSNIVDISLPNSLRYIGKDALNGTAWFESQSDGLVYLDNWLLGLKGNAIKTAEILTVRDGIKGIADYAFGVQYGEADGIEKNTHATKIILPDSVEYIGANAFEACIWLSDINIPNSVKEIGRYTFSNSAISSINLPNTLQKIKNDAFWGANIENVVIPDNVDEIGSRAFCQCRNLKEIYIPTSITKINRDTFYSCTALTDVFYAGTSEQWNNIEMNSNGNEPLLNATIHFMVKPCFSIAYSSGKTAVTNTEQDKQRATIIIAKYDRSGVLQAITSNNVDFAANETKQYDTDSHTKIFVWNSLLGMQPLTLE